MNAQAPFNGLALKLVNDNLLSDADMQQHLSDSRESKTSLVVHLVTKKILGGKQIANAAAHEFGTALFDLSAIKIDTIPKDILDKKLIIKHRLLPLFKRGKRLFVAINDPTDIQALDDVKFNTGLTVDGILVEADKLEKAVEAYITSEEENFGDALGGLDDDDLENIEVSSDTKKADSDVSEEDEAPVVRFINKVLLEAIKVGASDIHFEPYEKAYRIRFRTDGILTEVQRPPVNLATRLAARLKVMSQMDLSERRKPQDGRIKLKISARRAIDFRVNSLPTLFGEKIVLRILDPSSAKLGIDALGYEEDQKKMYLETLHQPQGMILVTGPTGSGKTVSLYTGLNILNTPELNISTAEDPVEINLEGINQVQVNSKVGLTFAEALRSFLRQDPDIVMVGEIRDLETAEIGIKAAQTGHLVLSTLHTNSAAETLTRLLNMGVPAFNVATTVSLIIAQRLARKLCSHCAVKSDLSDEILAEEGLTAEKIHIERDQWTIMKPVGCDQCLNGYKGRVGVYEVVRITPKISSLIMEGGNSLDIAKQAKAEGFNDLRVSALRKVATGLTSLEEANRVTKD